MTDTDVALLRALARDRSVVAASRSVGISRDRGTYRIARLNRAFGGPVVESDRGGRSHGESRLTELGDRIVRQGFDSVELLDGRPVSPPTTSNRFSGTYLRRPGPAVDVGGGVRLRVAFPAEEGERVSLLLDPEAILLAAHRFPSSARNVLPATVERVERSAGGLAATLHLRTGPLRWRVAVTEEPLRQLRLSPGRRVWVYVKATALRRVGRPSARPTRGSPRR
ncbi:MAG TPA: TOBE domain-containing protein [Thermoplasmata archaeon]|nr:TOBE domain-containing protein [Thermoplasmata archaeon]